MRFRQIMAAAWLMLLCAAAAGHAADKRVALVIGNAAYRHADWLANPVNDARSMRDVLKKLDFDVVYGEDRDLQAMKQLIREFARRVGGADVAVVYFAGHGSTFDNTSYVVPVDAQFVSLSAVPFELVQVEMLIGELREAKAVGIAILDACRDNKAERELKRTRGGDGTRGLVPVTTPKGMIVAYATQFMHTASDDAVPGGLFGWHSSAARHSPFTAALLTNIATPGLDVKWMLSKVAHDVVAATGGRQVPELAISMHEPYVLVPLAAPQPADTRPAETKPADTPSGAAALADAAQAFLAIQDTTSITALDDFLRLFGHVPVYGTLARAKREELAGEPAASANEPAIATKPAKEPIRPPEAHQAPAKPAEGHQMAAVAPPVKPATHGDDPCGAIARAFFPSQCGAPPLTFDGAPLMAQQEHGLRPKDSFRECQNCPEMVVVPAGSFTMGSPASEKDREADEGPQHVVTIGRPFAAGRLPVTVNQFAAFAGEVGYQASSTCRVPAGGSANKWEEKGSWRDPGFAQEETHPVVCLNWDDASAYVDWLANRTGKPYRLLTEAEWEYAARSRTSPGAYPRFWFGDDERDLCRHANGVDFAFGSRIGAPCNDGFSRTSPAGHYPPNAFGLHDMGGNARQWMADCYHDSYAGAPADGSAWVTGACGKGHAIRGGSFDALPRELRAARRDYEAVAYHSFGLRVARTLAR